MIIYLIKSALCLLCLLLFYKFALENENMHRFKRFYLLGSIIVAFSLPLFTFTYYTEAVPQTSSAVVSSEFFEIENPPLQKENADSFYFESYVPIVLWTLYGVGFMVFGFRFLRNLYEMQHKIRNNNKIRFKSHVKVLLEEGTAPHSFLKYIFIEKSAYKEKKIAPEIIVHEKAHVKQKHSLDILLVELLQVIFWFNPLFFILKNQIRINHEFLADENVIRKNIEPLHYSNVLFNFSAGTNHSTLSSPFNHLLIKKRIVMISKPFSRQRFISRLGLLIPIIAGCIFMFNNDIVAKPLPISIVEATTLQETNVISIFIQQEEIWLNGKKVGISEFSNELDKITEGKTDADLRKMNFNFSSSNPRNNLMSELNTEYKKTRFASVKGNDLIPPATPKAPSVPSVPPVPPAPESEDVSPAPSSSEHEQNIKEELSRAERMQMRYEEREKRAKERNAESQERMMERRQAAELRVQEMENRKEELEERRQQMEQSKQEMEERRQEIEERRQEMEERRQGMEERRQKMEQKRKETRKEIIYVVEDEKNPNSANGNNLKSMGYLASKERIDSYNGRNIPFFYEGKKISHKEALDLQSSNNSIFIKLVDDENGNISAHLFETFKIEVEKK